MNKQDLAARDGASQSDRGANAGRSRLFRLGRLVLALMFAGATLLYNVYWLSAIQPSAATVELGFDADYLPEENALLVTGVRNHSPAESAGLSSPVF